MLYNPSPDTNCHTFSNPLPLERDVLYGRPLDGLALLCMITPRSIPSSEALNVTPPMSYLNFLLPFPMCLITELLSTLKSIFQSMAHSYHSSKVFSHYACIFLGDHILA